MPRPTQQPQKSKINVEDLIKKQQKLDAEKESQRQRYILETLKISTALGSEIERTRTSVGLSRRYVCQLLNISNINLYFIERPAAARMRVTPQNQVRYLDAISRIADETKKVSETVTFVKGRGRPKKEAAAA